MKNEAIYIDLTSSVNRMLHGVRSGIWTYTRICGPVDLFVLSKEDNKSHLEINLSYSNKVFECDFCNAKLENTECLEKRQQSSHRSHIDSIDWQELCAFKKKKKLDAPLMVSNSRNQVLDIRRTRRDCIKHLKIFYESRKS